MRRLSGWFFRLDQELKIAKRSTFVTLTYNDENIISDDNGLYTLHKPDLQSFFKKLRQNEIRVKGNYSKIKYYACGEYGGLYQRPHYHIILFNAHEDMVIKSWINSNQYAIGNVHFGKVEVGSIKYVTGYINKGKIIPQFEGDLRKPEFSLMSKGLGENFLSNEMKIWFRNDPLERQYLPGLDGEKFAIPRYYKNKIWDEKEREEIGKVLTAMNEVEMMDHVLRNGAEPVHVAVERQNVLLNRLKTQRHEVL